MRKYPPRKQKEVREESKKVPTRALTPLSLFINKGEEANVEDEEHVPLRRAINRSNLQWPVFKETERINLLKSKNIKWGKDYMEEEQKKEKAVARRRNMGRGRGAQGKGKNTHDNTQGDTLLIIEEEVKELRQLTTESVEEIAQLQELLGEKMKQVIQREKEKCNLYIYIYI